MTRKKCPQIIARRYPPVDNVVSRLFGDRVSYYVLNAVTPADQPDSFCQGRYDGSYTHPVHCDEYAKALHHMELARN